MTDLERQLTAALERLSAQYEMEQRRHTEQVEALQQLVETLGRQVEQQSAQSETLREQVERLDGQVASWTDYFGTLAARSRGRRN